ncbi:3-hydroxybutyrate oligomer hydrolase family protein [Methylobacterium sp. ID0610]|uniref:3-hydroxybutyrate oligomer hydrolase family protein n=1 Tax=Methylobacterium carpenticola TaxID=3344827 RepID=UPI003697FCC3
MRSVPFAAACLTSTALGLCAAAAESGHDHGHGPGRPEGTVVRTRYDGTSNDLLTAGLGKSGLAGPAPSFANPLQPTAEELRRLAIYSNYRALVDMTPGGGYGTLYGPNVRADGTVTGDEGKIAGEEIIAYERDEGGRARVTLMVQVPDSYDPARGCIVAAPSSGSRGVYGAIATAGEWGLKHGCAVAYTDKGTGTGAHDLQLDTVNRLRGERAPAGGARADANFIARLSDSQRTAYVAANPYRFAVKHAHSQLNPEQDWGRNVLRSIAFAFDVLNDRFGRRGVRITKRNTIVIASSVSNGGGASVRAVEEDEEGLIDGLAVGEPNVNPRYSSAFAIVQGGGPPLTAHSRPLIDTITLVNVFQGCAGGAPENAATGFGGQASAARCAELHAKGLLAGADLAAQQTEAQGLINAAGILREQNLVQPGYWASYVPQSISVTYANAYGRFGVTDNLCAYSFAAGPTPSPLAPAAAAQLFGTSNGIPPTGGLALINNAAPGGPKEDRISTPGQNLDGALCLRGLATGRDPAAGTALTGPARGQAERVAAGVREILASGRLRRVPAIFVTGRNDGILPPNHTSRAYVGLNAVTEGGDSLRYYEIKNAHHLDAFNAFPGYAAAYIPLHRYFIQAMDLMEAHLRQKRPLPPSQVVETVPRGAGLTPITTANVPPIADAPPPAARITFANGQLRIPD